MAQGGPLILRLVATCITAANRAGMIVRDVMSHGELGIIDKGKNDLQTEADRSAQLCIIESLHRKFPSVTIIGEEGESNSEVPSDWIVTDTDVEILGLKCPEDLKDVSPADVCIWVDPLDGTNEYTQGLLDHVTVLIGIAVGTQPVAGVIHQPYYNYKKAGTEGLGRTLWGIRGLGVGGFEPHPPPTDRRILTTTRTHSDVTVQATLDAMKPDEIVRVGGAGYKVLLLMEGHAHAYVFASAGCKRWDTCAPEAILTAMGGRLTDLTGVPYAYDRDTPHANSKGVLATALGEQHDAYLKLIPDAIRTRFAA